MPTLLREEMGSKVLFSKSLSIEEVVIDLGKAIALPNIPSL